MFRHIALVKFKPESNESERLPMREAVEKLPSQVKEVVAARAASTGVEGRTTTTSGAVFDRAVV